MQVSHSYAKNPFAGIRPFFGIVVVFPVPLVEDASLDSHACFSDGYERAADFQAEFFVGVVFFGRVKLLFCLISRKTEISLVVTLKNHSTGERGNVKKTEHYICINIIGGKSRGIQMYVRNGKCCFCCALIIKYVE